jgi:hypothetical protein
MITTVQQLREALHDAPDDMPLRVMVNRGVLIGVDHIEWLQGRCVIVARHTLTLKQEKENGTTA